jgi:hypothetical protein
LKVFEFVGPGHPIYKASIVPLRGGEHVQEVTQDEVANWQKVLGYLGEFLKAYVSFAAEFRRLERYERYEILADGITLFFKIPLLRESIPSLAPSPLKVYVFYRLIPYREIGALSKDPLDFALSTYGEVSEKFANTDLYNYIEKPEYYSAVERAWFSLPADTRPGHNTSGLIPHLLTTSAIAWALAQQDNLDRERAAKVRLAALFHDMGKPFDFRRHYRLSPELVEGLLRGVIKNEEVEEMKELVKHHGEGRLSESKYIQEADSFASVSDRLGELVKEIIRPELRRISVEAGLDVEAAYKAGEEAWAFWEQLHRREPEVIKRLSERFAKTVFEGQIPALPSTSKELGISLALFDLGGIQEFIMRTNNLRCTAASSLVVDLATMAHIPLSVQAIVEEKMNCWVPFEAFLYSSGGVVNAVLPDSVASRLKDYMQELARKYAKSGLRLYYARTASRGSYYEASGRLAAEMAKEKLKLEGAPSRPSPINLTASGQMKLCEICFLDPPSQQLRPGREVCETCYKLYEIGENVHYAKRWDSSIMGFKPRDVFEGVTWEMVSEGVMELIAGHSIEDLRKMGLLKAQSVESGEVRTRNLALIRMDGNLMGLFFANAISLTDAVERSARVDLALKRGFEEAVRTLRKAVVQVAGQAEADRTVSAVWLGLLYMGGDDAAILCPSWAALPLSLYTASNFNQEMGGSRSLSVGLVGAPPAHDVWALYDAAGELLKEAKKLGRKEGLMGAICFDIIEGGTLSGSSAVSRLRELRAKRITVQPMLLKGDEWFSIERLLNWVGINTHEAESVFAAAYKASRDEEDDLQDRLKKVREALRTSVRVGEETLGGKARFDITLIFTFKGKFEAKHAEYDALIKLLTYEPQVNGKERREERCFPLADMDRLIKLLGGGVI